MKSWHLARNTLYKKADVTIEEGPWWAFFIMESSQWVCHYIPSIPFPPIGKVMDEKDSYNWREWYGDLNSWWHGYVDEPVLFWAYRKIKRHFINIPYNRHRTINKEFGIKWDRT
jgi:hypothetical protein